MSELSTITPSGHKPARHKWGEPVRFPFKTERTCIVCGMMKVTRHEPGERPWLEFFNGMERIVCDRTPECDGAP